MLYVLNLYIYIGSNSNEATSLGYRIEKKNC